MNKQELVKAVAEKSGLKHKEAESCVNALIDTIVETVAAGDEVRLIGFGTFKAIERAARTGVNPATGKKIKIKAKRVPRLVPGSKFKEAVAKKKKASAKKKK